MAKHIVKNRYSQRQPTGITFTGKTRTKQSEAQDADINAIIKRHDRTGVVTHLASKAPRYGDFSQSVTLQEALDLVHQSDDAFMQLPSEVRRESGNDPARMLELLATQEGTERLIEARLDAEIRREPEEEIVPEPTPQPDPEGPPRTETVGD